MKDGRDVWWDEWVAARADRREPRAREEAGGL